MRPLSSAVARVEARLDEILSPSTAAVGLLYNALPAEQRELWDATEDELERAGRDKCEVMLAAGAEKYVLVMLELIEYAEQRVRHSRIARRLGEDCWMAREGG